jgi:hypothetical protein
VRFKVTWSRLRNRRFRDLSAVMKIEFSDAEMVEFFQAHPAFRARFVALARAVENSEGRYEEADAVEEAVGTGGAAGLGRAPRGRDGAGNSSATSYASPR